MLKKLDILTPSIYEESLSQIRNLLSYIILGKKNPLFFSCAASIFLRDEWLLFLRKCFCFNYKFSYPFHKLG